MKNKKIYFLLMLVLIMTITSIILLKQNKKNDEPEINLMLRKALIDFDFLKNTEIIFIKDLFKDIDKTKEEINYLLIYDDYSCPPCNEKAKLMSRRINNYPVYRFYLLKEDKYKKVVTNYYAKSDSVYYYLEKFKNITTPVIIKFNSTFKVLDAFFPTVHKDEEFEEFIDR